MDYLAEAGVQAFAVAYREFEGTVVAGEDQDVASGIEDGGADLAVGQVLFDVGTSQGVKGVVEIAGDIVPYMAAVQNHGNLLRRAGAALASCGASCFCSIRRAR